MRNSIARTFWLGLVLLVPLHSFGGSHPTEQTFGISEPASLKEKAVNVFSESTLILTAISARGPFGKTAAGMIYALKSGLVTSIYAKEICSCIHIQKIGNETCRAHANMFVTDLMIHVDVSDSAKSVTARAKRIELEGGDSRWIELVRALNLNPPVTAVFRANGAQAECHLLPVENQERGRG